MKRVLHVCFTGLFAFVFCNLSYSQNYEYFREGFEIGGTWPTASYTTPQYVTGSSGATFYAFGVYRTTGSTGACSGQTGGASHARFANLSATDSAYLITPPVSFGINTLSFYNGRASRRFTIYKRTVDTTIEALPGSWTFVTHIPATNLACDVVTVNVNDASAKRLMIVSRAGTDSDIDSLVMTSVNPILPVTLLGAKAYIKERGVQVDWSVATESNIANYSIERSVDGRQFTAVAAVPVMANGANAKNYTWYDASPNQGVNYYRIKANDNDGSFKYSSILKINTSTSKAEVSVAPNPIKSGQLNLQLSSLTKGEYSLQLYNNVGQLVFSSKLSSESGSLSQSFILPVTVKAGIYNLQVTGADVKLNKRVVVE